MYRIANPGSMLLQELYFFGHNIYPLQVLLEIAIQYLQFSIFLYTDDRFDRLFRVR
jgi:hypothetical protein